MRTYTTILGEFMAGEMRLDPALFIPGFRKARNPFREEKTKAGTLQ